MPGIVWVSYICPSDHNAPEGRALSSVPTAHKLIRLQTHAVPSHPVATSNVQKMSPLALQTASWVTSSHRWEVTKTRKILNLQPFGQQTQTTLWAESRHTTENDSNTGPNYIYTNPKAHQLIQRQKCIKKNCPCNLTLLLKQGKSFAQCLQHHIFVN